MEVDSFLYIFRIGIGEIKAAAAMTMQVYISRGVARSVHLSILLRGSCS
jgi:hypothetical protein